MRDAGFLLLWMAMLLPVLQAGAPAAILLWLWTSLLAPNDVMYGLAAGVPFSKAATAVAVPLILLGRGGGMRFRFNPTNLLMLALALSALVSQAGALSVTTDYGWDLYQKLAKILLLAILVPVVMRDRFRIHALVFAICLGIAFTGVQEALKWLASGGAHQILGSASTGDNNQVGLDVLLIVPLLAWLYGVCRQKLARLACMGTGVLCALTAVGSNSRGAFVGLVILALGLVATGRRKLLGVVFVLLLAGIGSQLVPQSWYERMDTIQTAQDDDSFEGRVIAWKMSLLIALDHPLFGGGMHAVQLPDVWEHYKPHFDEVSFIPSEPVTGPHAAHSIYFEVLGDLGFVGLGLFVSMFLLGLYNGRAVRRAVRASGRDDLLWAADLARKLQLSLAIFMVSGAALSAAYFDIDYELLALMVALRDVIEREPGVRQVRRPTALRTPVPLLVPADAVRVALPTKPNS